MSATVRETPTHRYAHIRRSDIPPLWWARRSWPERLLDWWHERQGI